MAKFLYKPSSPAKGGDRLIQMHCLVMARGPPLTVSGQAETHPCVKELFWFYYYDFKIHTMAGLNVFSEKHPTVIRCRELTCHT